MSVVNFFPPWISTCFSTIYQRELFHIKFYWHLCWTSSIWALYSDSLIYEFIIMLNRKFAVLTSVVFWWVLKSLSIFPPVFSLLRSSRLFQVLFSIYILKISLPISTKQKHGSLFVWDGGTGIVQCGYRRVGSVGEGCLRDAVQDLKQCLESVL